MLYSAIRPLLFSLDAELSHHLSLGLLNRTHCLLPSPKQPIQTIEVMGLNFPNRVGLAAGLDKNGEYLSGLGKLGFGFIEIGTVTPLPQSGNPKPRLFRLTQHKAIINRMGFNNNGLDYLVSQVKKSAYNGVLGINIGKNKDTPNAEANADYLTGLHQVYPYADYITVNVSSPNTAGLRDLQHEDSLRSLLDALKSAQLSLSREHSYKPIVVKIAPDLSDASLIKLAHLLIKSEIDGVIATNTTINKTSVATHPHGNEVGGLSGQPLTQSSTNVIKILADEINGKLPIIGVGGILTAQDALDKLNAGASLLQLYSGLIYHGPKLIASVVSATSDYQNK